MSGEKAGHSSSIDKQLLIWLLLASRGGESRTKILFELKKRPSNANSLSKVVGLDYVSTRYHLKLLEENGVLTTKGNKYGKVYFLSKTIWENFKTIQKIIENDENGENTK